MEKKSFSIRSLFMPVIVSSAATVFLISVFVTNQLFYKPTVGYAAGEGGYAAATINFFGVPASGSYFLLQDSWGNDVRFEVQESIPGSQNGEFQNGAYIIAGDGADAIEIASRTQSVVLTKYNDNTILAQPTLDGTTVTLTETRIGEAYNRAIDHSANSNWVISDFTGGVNPDPDPVIGANADTPIGVYLIDNFGNFSNEIIQAQNNSEDVTWPMGGGGAGPYIGLANQKFDIVYFDVRGSTWDTEASPTVQYSKGSGEWGNISEAVFDPTPTPFNIGTSQSSITSISFTPPEDWEQNTVDSKTAYYIRFSETSSGFSGATVRQISLRAHVANIAPTVSINSADAYQTGTGDVSITATVNDADNDNVSIQFQFQETTCGSMLANGKVSSTASGSGSGALTVLNTNQYQVGGISTALSDEFVSFVWESANDVPNADGVYCLSLTPYDGTAAGTSVTTTVMLDNLAPTQPGNLSVSSVGINRVTFTLPTSATSSDSNFSQYKIHYTTGTSAGVGDTAHDGIFGDEDLSDASFNGNDSTTITGLIAGTTYRANIFAYDSYGNSTAAAEQVSFTTREGVVATTFSTSSGSTDFSTVEDISSVENARVATVKGSIQWANPVNAAGADLDTNIVIGDGFVSVNAENLDGSFDTPATVSMSVESCNNYQIYYTSNFFSTREEIISNGQLCNANTNPTCTVVSCTEGVLTFTVPHFDGFGVQIVNSGGASGGQILRNQTKPSVYKFNINGGVSATNNREVIIDFGVSDALKMAVSLDKTFEDAAYDSYNESISFRLSETPGTQLVYARFLSYDGIMTQAQRSIVYDQTGQTVPTVITEPIVEDIIETKPIVETKPVITDKNNCPLPAEKSYKSGPRQAVYYVTNDCTRKRVTNSNVFFSYFNSFDSIVTVNESLLNKIPMDSVQVLPYGPRVIVTEGALIKTITSPQVFFIENGVKRVITSEAVFNARGFLWGAISDVVHSVLEKFEDGDPIK